MTSNKIKGDLKENLCKKILESWGYTAEKVPNRIVWIQKGERRIPISQGNDLFGCLDVIAFNNEHFRGAQVTYVEHKLERMEKVLKHIWPKNSIIETWCWKGGRKKIDRRFKKEKRWTINQVFYIYRLNHNSNKFELYKTINKDGSDMEELE